MKPLHAAFIVTLKQFGILQKKLFNSRINGTIQRITFDSSMYEIKSG